MDPPIDQGKDGANRKRSVGAFSFDDMKSLLQACLAGGLGNFDSMTTALNDDDDPLLKSMTREEFEESAQKGSWTIRTSSLGRGWAVLSARGVEALQVFLHDEDEDEYSHVLCYQGPDDKIHLQADDGATGEDIIEVEDFTFVKEGLDLEDFVDHVMRKFNLSTQGWLQRERATVRRCNH